MFERFDIIVFDSKKKSNVISNIIYEFRDNSMISYPKDRDLDFWSFSLTLFFPMMKNLYTIHKPSSRATVLSNIS